MHAHDSIKVSTISESVRIALTEDIGQGDVSAALCDPHNITAKVICRETATLCGQAWFDETFKQLDPDINVKWSRADGNVMHPGMRFAKFLVLHAQYLAEKELR